MGLSNYAIALDFALAYPNRMHKLVLVSPGLRGYEFRDLWVGARFAAMRQALEGRDLAGAVEVFLTIGRSADTDLNCQRRPGCARYSCHWQAAPRADKRVEAGDDVWGGTYAGLGKAGGVQYAA